MSRAINFGPYVNQREEKTLRWQLDRLRDHMLANAIRDKWETLEEICEALREMYPGVRFRETSISAQIRNLRKPEGGSWRTPPRRRNGTGPREYRIFPPLKWEPDQQELFENSEGKRATL